MLFFLFLRIVVLKLITFLHITTIFIITVYTITTCGTKGRFGPSQKDCDNEYNDTEVKVLNAPGLSGVQKWKAPGEGFYTYVYSFIRRKNVNCDLYRFFLFGASGGKGSGGMGSSRGAMVRMVVELRKGQEFYILVGQEGANACLKVKQCFLY